MVAFAGDEMMGCHTGMLVVGEAVRRGVLDASATAVRLTGKVADGVAAVQGMEGSVDRPWDGDHQLRMVDPQHTRQPGSSRPLRASDVFVPRGL